MNSAGSSPRAIARPADGRPLVADIDALDDAARIVAAGDYEVFCAGASQLPAVLPEIGRLRELAFRAVGEGSGKPRDLDRFDETYRHLFVWDRRRREIAGAYRVGATDELTRVAGVHGLYTRTLFDYDQQFVDELGPALELGRSFVSPAYQRDFLPLMLLWKGIARLVVDAPKYRRLFGVVSISDRYQSMSRQLLISFLQSTRFDADLGRLVRAKHPPAMPPSTAAMGTPVIGFDDVSARVRALEPDGKDVPILLKQYLKLNARLLGFSIDPAFSHVLDGLMAVDLTEVEPAILARYMGRSEAQAFLSRAGAVGRRLSA